MEQREGDVVADEVRKGSEIWLASNVLDGRRFTIWGTALLLGASAVFGVFLGGAFFGGGSRLTSGASANNIGAEIAGTFIAPILMMAIYLIPTFIALKQGHRHTLAIFICNVLGGLFYGLGWLASLIWVWNIPPTEAAQGVPETAGESEKP